MVSHMDVYARLVVTTGTTMKIAIIIPAHNEQDRIHKTLNAYHNFFEKKTIILKIKSTFIVVLNGCTDNTLEVVADQQRQLKNIEIIVLKKSGKGRAIKKGFERALHGDFDLIGFVDADMATKPEYFYELIEHINDYDGIIASRYLKESKIFPARPAIKEWGRRLIYQPIVRLLFNLRFADYQCGAKLFRRKVIEKVTPHLIELQWTFDVELLYLCKKYGFKIKEWPTVWYDQTDSKLSVSSAGFAMLFHLFKIRWHHFKN